MPVAILVLCDNDQAAAHFEDTIKSAVAISRFRRIRQHIAAPLHVVKWVWSLYNLIWQFNTKSWMWNVLYHANWQLFDCVVSTCYLISKLFDRFTRNIKRLPKVLLAALNKTSLKVTLRRNPYDDFYRYHHFKLFCKKIVSHYHRLPFGMLVIGENVIRNRDKKQLLK